MTVYLYPNLKSKKAFRDALIAGKTITAERQTPWGAESVKEGSVTFSGPHYPEPHRFYGAAVVSGGRVVSVK